MNDLRVQALNDCLQTMIGKSIRDFKFSPPTRFSDLDYQGQGTFTIIFDDGRSIEIDIRSMSFSVNFIEPDTVGFEFDVWR